MKRLVPLFSLLCLLSLSGFSLNYTPRRELAAKKMAQHCTFCADTLSDHDAWHFVLYRGKRSFIKLDPLLYVPGALIIVPYLHTDSMLELTPAAWHEMCDLALRSCRIIADYTGFMPSISIVGEGTPHVYIHIVPFTDSPHDLLTYVPLQEVLAHTYTKLLPLFRK